jgi:predicted transcriptional regulator
MQDLLLSIVTDEPGVSISKLAQMTGMDPKQVRGRVRGSETMEATKNGRTTKVYLKGVENGGG